jgi:hypothetical protein
MTQTTQTGRGGELIRHYAAVKARLRNVPPPPPERPRRFIDVRPQSHRPDVVLPMVRLPIATPAIRARQREFLTVMKFENNSRSSCPDWMWRPILAEVLAKYPGVSELDIVRDIRPTNVVAARQELFYRMRVELSVSFERIGKIVGNRDHTSVRHGYLKHKARLEAAGL